MNPIRWILLPGLDGSGELFDDFARRRAGEDVQIVRYPADASWNFDDYVEHVCAMLDEQRPSIVIGESFSGPIALRLQRRRPDIVAVVLVATFVTCPNPLLKFIPQAVMGERLRRLVTSSALVRTMCLGLDAADGLVREIQRVVRAIPIDVVRARLHLLRDLDERACVRAPDVPLLVITAADDRLVGAQPELIAAVNHVALRGPHFLLQARPDACW